MRRWHLPAVLRIEHRSHPKPWSLGVFNSELAPQDAPRYYVVLKTAGPEKAWPAPSGLHQRGGKGTPKVAGYGGLMFVADEAHVTNIAVAPSLRRLGLGTRLLVHLAMEATRRGCSAMTLEVRVGNLGAQALYQGLGFVAAGVRRNYYPETREDALVMWLYHLGSEDVQARLSGWL